MSQRQHSKLYSSPGERGAQLKTDNIQQHVEVLTTEPASAGPTNAKRFTALIKPPSAAGNWP